MCPQPSRISRPASCGTASARRCAWEGGVSLSFSPAITSVGHVEVLDAIEEVHA